MASFTVTNTVDSDLWVSCSDTVTVMSCGNGVADPGEECGDGGLACIA